MDIGQFVKDYGLYILQAIAVIIGFITIFCKKRPKTLNDFMDCIYQCQAMLPTLISSVERPGDGALKKEEVLLASLGKASLILGRKLSSDEIRVFNKCMSESIEDILSTPTKKGI